MKCAQNSSKNIFFKLIWAFWTFLGQPFNSINKQLKILPDSHKKTAINSETKGYQHLPALKNSYQQ